MQFRLTRRAIADLGLSVDDHASRPATDYVEAHGAVRAFVERRRQDPGGQEWTNLPATAARAANLHFGRHRGLTWHDQASDVVWLLGVGWHESGSLDDAYDVLKARDRAGTLMPDEQDYLDLEMSYEEAHSFVVLVSHEAPALVERARQAPSTEVRGIVAGRLGPSRRGSARADLPDMASPPQPGMARPHARWRPKAARPQPTRRSTGWPCCGVRRVSGVQRDQLAHLSAACSIPASAPSRRSTAGRCP